MSLFNLFRKKPTKPAPSTVKRRPYSGGSSSPSGSDSSYYTHHTILGAGSDSGHSSYGDSGGSSYGDSGGGGSDGGGCGCGGGGCD